MQLQDHHQSSSAMPKKFKGENSKAVVAKARKAEAMKAETERIERQKEDESWHDDSKQVARKQQRKAEADKKRQEAQARKLENKQLLEEEEANLPVQAAGVRSGSKFTRAEIEANQQKQREEEEREKKRRERQEAEPALEENPNIALAEAAAEGRLDARSVGDAISVLSINEPAPAIDKHPEKRLKAAFTAFEEVNLPRLKRENPNLRLSQLKQMLKKEWTKSPDNPLNQRLANARKK